MKKNSIYPGWIKDIDDQVWSGVSKYLKNPFVLTSAILVVLTTYMQVSDAAYEFGHWFGGLLANFMA